MKRFERSNGLDTALYKNYLYLFFYKSSLKTARQLFMDSWRIHYIDTSFIIYVSSLSFVCVPDATRPTDVAGVAHSSLVDDLRGEIERLKATSVSSEKHEALRADVTQLRDEFAALKTKMSARISELMDEVDDEKKVRMTMQVEIERIRKLTKHT